MLNAWFEHHGISEHPFTVNFPPRVIDLRSLNFHSLSDYDKMTTTPAPLVCSDSRFTILHSPLVISPGGCINRGVGASPVYALLGI